MVFSQQPEKQNCTITVSWNKSKLLFHLLGFWGIMILFCFCWLHSSPNKDMINSQPSPGKPLLTVDDTSNFGSLYFLNAPHCGMGSPHGVHSDLSENGVWRYATKLAEPVCDAGNDVLNLGIAADSPFSDNPHSEVPFYNYQRHNVWKPIPETDMWTVCVCRFWNNPLLLCCWTFWPALEHFWNVQADALIWSHP